MAEFSFDPEAPADEELPASTDGVYTLNEAHVAEGISHLIDFFRSGPRNQAELAAYLDQAQEIEDMLWVLKSAFDVDTAVGVQLNYIGKKVGEPRLGRDDEQYRSAIRVRVMVNNSDGRAEQMIEIANAMFPEETYTMSVNLDEAYPRTITVYLEGDPGAVTLTSVARLLRLAKPAGSQLGVVLGLDDSDGSAARWASADEVDLVTGWGLDTDDSHTATGGDWASVL
jgi:hypothetical protein